MFPVPPLFASSLCAVAAAAGLMLFESGTAAAADPIAVARVYDKERGEEVTLEGRVQEFRSSDRANVPNAFALRDESGSIRVAIWPNVFNELPFREQVNDGAVVRVTGAVAEFRGKMEVHVRSADGIELVKGQGGGSGTTSGTAQTFPRAGQTDDRTTTGPRPRRDSSDAPPVVNPGVAPIAVLTRERLNEVFTISGTLSSARRPSGDRTPFILRIVDPTGAIDVVFWDDVAAQLPDSKKVESGDPVQVTGRLGEHRGNLQLRVNAPDDIKTPGSDPDLFQKVPSNDTATTLSASPRAAAELVDSGEVASRPVGRWIKVGGTVTSIEPLRLGRKVHVQTETTSPEAILLLWDTAEGLKPEVHQLKTSSTLTVTGVVAEARGTRVVVVAEPEDVVAVEP